MKHLLIGLLFMGCAQDNSEITAVLEQNTEALKNVSMAEPTVVGYQIVKTSSADKLQEEVTALMGEGWQPLGGHQYALRYNPQAHVKYTVKATYYQQTMVKYGTPNENGDDPK